MKSATRSAAPSGGGAASDFAGGSGRIKIVRFASITEHQTLQDSASPAQPSHLGDDGGGGAAAELSKPAAWGGGPCAAGDGRVDADAEAGAAGWLSPLRQRLKLPDIGFYADIGTGGNVRH